MAPIIEFLKRIFLGNSYHPIPEKDLRKLSNFFREDFSGVEIRKGGLCPRIFPFYKAIVFGPVINVRPDCIDIMRYPIVYAEEFAHVVQWRRYKWYRFLFMYFWAHLTNGNGYDGNPYENAAKQTAWEFVSWTQT
jgi:hypothetical protein